MRPLVPPSMFWGYILHQRPYRTSEHCSTIFITPIIILNTKNRGSLGVLGAKVHAKDRQILCVVLKTCDKSLRKQCLAAIEAISRLPGTVFHESIGSYRHVQKIPTPKKRFDGILWMFFWGGATAPGGGAFQRVPIWKNLWNKVLCVQVCNLAWCLKTCRAFGCKKQ